MTGNPVSWCFFFKGWIFNLADILRYWTAGVEAAARRWFRGAWYVAFQDDPLPLAFFDWIRDRHSRQQCDGIGVHFIIKEFVLIGKFN